MLGFGHLALRETFNKRLTLSVLLIMFSQFNFGFDQQGFAASQAMESFAKQFGKWDPKKEEWYLPSVWLSWFNGLNYLGQAAGENYTTEEMETRLNMLVSRCYYRELRQQTLGSSNVYVYHEPMGSGVCNNCRHIENFRPNSGISSLEL